MNTLQLKQLTGEKSKYKAIDSIYKRLEKRNWSSCGKMFQLSGIDSRSLNVHLVSVTSIQGGGASVDRRVLPLEVLIDCISGRF
jgi:hypothetical protein